MVGFARAHHPSNCLILNNRNRFGDGNVAAAATAQAKSFTTFCMVGNDDTIDSIGCGTDDRSDCVQRQEQQKPKHQHRLQSQRCIISDKTEPNSCRNRRHRRCHRANVQIDQCNGGSRRRSSGMWCRVQATVNSCNLSVSLIFCAAISLLLLNIDVIKAEPQQQQQQQQQITTAAEEQCEPKVLEETPPDPVSWKLLQSMVIFYFSFQ